MEASSLCLQRSMQQSLGKINIKDSKAIYHMRKHRCLWQTIVHHAVPGKNKLPGITGSCPETFNKNAIIDLSNAYDICKSQYI